MARWLSSLLSLVGAFHLVSAGGTSPDRNATHLVVNVLTGRDGASAFQCWSVEPPFIISQQPGTVGAKIQRLGNSTGSTVVFFDPKNDIDAGLHNAPDPQWVMVLQGSGVVTLPTTNASISLPLGGIIIANDTAAVSAVGHETKWAAGSVALQMPFTDRVVPDHTILNEFGPCPDPGHHHPHHGHN